jgi:hypothetical protein
VRCTHQWQPPASPDALPVCSLCHQSPTASPSQVETWRDCQRKHAYSRIRPRTFNAAAAFGDRAHGIVERWLRDGVPPDANTPEGRCILTGISLLPPPRTPGLLVEPPVRPVLFGVQWDMRLDYLWAPGPSVLLIGDHKTTGNIKDNAKTTEELETTDPQGLAYGHWGTTTFDVAEAAGQWTYYQRDARVPAKPVPFRIRRADVAERFRAMHEAEVLPMVRSRWLPPEELPRNLAACTKYGGCSYQAECLAGVSGMELAAASLKKLAPSADPLAALIAANPPETTMTPMSPELLAVLQANGGKLPPATPSVVPTPGPNAPAAPAPSDLSAFLAALPADARAQVEAAMAKAAAGNVPLPAEGPAVGVLPIPIAPPPVVDVPQLPQDTATPPKSEMVVEPKKRGRPKKADAVATPALPDPADPCTTVTEEYRDEYAESLRMSVRRDVVIAWLGAQGRDEADLDLALAKVAGG